MCVLRENVQEMDGIDEFDRKILQALQSDGRLTNAELADRVGLSASQCSRRRTQLENTGVITGYHAHLDGERVGIGLVSLVSITLSHHDEKNADRLRQLLQQIPNVQHAYALTGEMDYLVSIATRDLNELSELINKTLLPHAAVQNVKTAIALETIKDTGYVPV